MTYPPTWKWNKHGKVLEGVYMGAFPNVGKGGRSVLYAIKDKSGKTWTIWGTKEIMQALQLRKPGKKIRIQFLNTVKTKRGFTAYHFQINVGKGEGEPDLKNNRRHDEKQLIAAARHRTPRQSLSRPIKTVGRVVAHASAAKNISIQPKKRGRPRKVKEGIVLDQVTAPPPVPPVNSFLAGWKQRLKKI